MWEFFGLTPITVWQLPANHFFIFARDIDKVRRERRHQAAKNAD